MKAIVCERPGLLQTIDVELPSPREGEAVVRIRRIGICGTDLHAYQGNQPFFSYPRILGHELAGVVEAVAEHTEGVRPGDQVSIIPYLHCGRCVACRAGKTNCCTRMRVLGVHEDGGMREQIAVPVSHLIPAKGLTLDQTALLEPLSIGMHAIRRSELQAGETALVIGAGPIGLGVMAFAKQAGARVIALDVNDKRLAFCRAWAGADAAVNGADSPEAKIAELTGGDYPTAVFDATGSKRSMESAYRYVAHGGRLVYVGLVREHIQFDDPEFHKREMAVMGSRNATREDFGRVADLLQAGKLDTGSYITHRMPFAELADRFTELQRPESGVIKAVAELEE